jgi:hypothetical protein
MLVIKRGYDLSKWLLDHTGKFPKSFRFSVATKIENAILDFLEMTTVANMRQDKLPLLRRSIRRLHSRQHQAILSTCSLLPCEQKEH